MTELADKIEAAKGPSRELDELIERAVGTYSAFSYYTLGDNDQPDYVPTRYTASLDAAMSLLDPRAMWAVINMEDGPIARVVWPQADGGYVGGYFESRAATPALALCVAALRAQQEQTP